MPKPRTESGEKNLISKRLTKLRQERIETNKRYVSDLELKAIAEIFHVSYVYLLDGEE